MSSSHRVLAWFALAVAIAIGVITIYTVFEYTLVSDMRERLAGADTKDGAALGRLLFDTRGCSACHTLVGISTSDIGPELTAIVANASVTEIAVSIANPDAEISTNCGAKPCPAGLMPEFGTILDQHEINALVEFLLQYAGRESDILP